MDTEEHIEIQHAESAGHPHTDEGPYYHRSWWKSYQGGVKGKLGGIIIGAIVGAGVGLAASAILSFAVAEVSIAAITAGFAAAGMLFAAHEFADVGKITGAVASAQQEAEERMKNFENGKFQEIKKEINELKALVTGQPVPVEPAQPTQDAVKAAANEQDYRMQHVHEDQQERGFKPIFWKIAAIGAVVGIAAGAMLAAGGISGHVIEALGFAAHPLSEAGTYAASMITLGLLGGSYGVNRDIFRKIFDGTDHLFKGIFSFGGKGHEQEPEASQATVKQEKPVSSLAANTVTTVVYENYTDYPQSDTHHRDRVLAEAKQALLSLDPTIARPH